MSFNITKTKQKRVVIVGGGFGGLKLANELHQSGFQVVLIDKNNHHQFPPLIYQVASSGLEPSSISFPFRKLFNRHQNIHFRMAEAKQICQTKEFFKPLSETLITIIWYWQQAQHPTFSGTNKSKRQPCP